MVARREIMGEVCCSVNLCFGESARITRLMAFTVRLLEPLAREPMGFLTQSLLEKCYEKSRDLYRQSE